MTELGKDATSGHAPYRAVVTGTSASVEAEEGPGRRVLVVDDERINRLALCKTLEHLGYDVDGAENGRQALEMLAAGTYGVVFMDVEMPVMGGVEATRRIRGADRPEAGNLPVVALTGHTGEAERRALLDAGMTVCLGKPVERDELKAVLAETLGAADEAPVSPPEIR